MTSLEAFFAPIEDPMVNAVQTLSEKIKQRRHQMLVHSYMYYVLDENVVDDGKWQEWADELTELQKQRKDIGFYDEVFADWDGSTGCHLPQDPWIIHRCEWLIKNHPKLK
jgi:hypothetical protein